MLRSPLTANSVASFRHHNFRLYWSAQLISLMGTFMQVVALGYLVYSLTGSKWLLGAISALQMGPSLLLSLPAGVVADRVSRRRLIISTQSTALILAFALATLTAAHLLQVWEILLISTLSGIAIAVESPARQAFVVELVGLEDLPNAIGWNSLVINGSRVLGPAAGGIAIRFFGVAPIFYYNSFSFLAMIVALSFMQVGTAPRATRHPLEDLREGLSYVRASSSILFILGLTALVATFVMNFSVLMPIIARDVVHTGAEGLGWMWTAMGIGAVAGSMTVVTWSRAAIGGPLLVISALAAGAATLALSRATTLHSSLLLLVVVGWSTGAFFASANSAIQNRVASSLRGRVLSLYSMIFSGSGPIGGLFVAALASQGGASLALAIGGAIGVGGAALMAPTFLSMPRAVNSP